MIEDKQNIKIYEIIEICARFLNQPDNVEYVDDFKELKQSLNIMSYMPIQQKEFVLRKALIDIQTIDTESYHFTTALEISKLFNILLAYITNLDLSIESLWKDYNTYDIIYASGLADYIITFIKDDYGKCEKMMDAVLSIDNIKKLLNEIKNTTPEEIDRLTKAFENFTLNTDIEALKAYSNITAQNDPLLTNIKDGIERGAYESAQKILNQ